MIQHHGSISTFVLSNATHALFARLLGSIGLVMLVGCSAQNIAIGPIEPGPPADAQRSRVAAIIEDRTITISDLHEYMKEQFLEEFLRQPEAHQYEMRETAVRDLVQRQVIETEAKRRGKYPTEIYDEIANSVSEPTSEEISDWYTRNQSRLRGAKVEDVASTIKEVILRERRGRALSDFLAPKLEALSWQLLLAPPRANLEITRLVRGPADAPVTIVTFSDYQCPYCARAEPMLTEVLERYPEKVRLVHRHFPLVSIHPFARPAAEASMCAEEQGKFWEYHDGIFSLRGRLEDDSLAKIGSAVGLDIEEFDRCMLERRYEDFVDADFAAGQGAGVTGTPSFFINGIKLKGARDADDLSRHVDQELARIQAE